MHRELLDAMRAQRAFTTLANQLPDAGTTIDVAGLPGSAPSLLLAALSLSMPGRVWLALAPGPAEAEAAEADLHALLDAGAAALYPQRETLPYEAEEHHLEVSGLRVEALEAMLAGRTRILVTTARAVQELAAMPAGLTDLRLALEVRQILRPHDLAHQLDEMGFERVSLVESVGQYALRGGILDLFGFGAPDPVRVEFWGDEIASLRRFDILDQRSSDDRQRVEVLPVDLRPVRPGAAMPLRRSLLDVVPPDTVVVEWPGFDGARVFERTWEQVLHLHEAERRRGGAPEPPDTLFLPPPAARAHVGQFARVRLEAQREVDIRFSIREAEAVNRDMDALQTLLRIGAARSERTLILCDNTGQLERLEELLGTGERLPGTTLALGAIASGFVLENEARPFRVLTDHEIFRRARRLRRTRRFRGAAALESLSQLHAGDFVVHLDHGIGRFAGLERVTVADEEIESLAIEYANGETLRVPVYRLDLVERWVPDREGAKPPRLHRIGGRTWKTLRRKTEQAIQQMAVELLELQAARQLAERTPYGPDTRWQKELESGFLYEDTPDQRQATTDVKRDMESRHPMDRLLCGDVGYGKTEIAIRAAFKAIQEGRQVALLAPTTILVEQHLHTFRQRLAGFPVRIEALSRFRPAKEQQQILAGLAGGEVDIVIGTHRLLEPDVIYRSLGLVMVDEEQRFGVRQKERFKQIKNNVDMLALTATPIPRTLHFSLSGLRDLSLLRTPPRDRMPIITHVLPWVDEVLEDAIRRELDRGGQVFVVHNRVQTIEGAAGHVRRLVPDATIGIAHGQMGAAELDNVMRRFLAADIRVLVTTAIIENGLDVPTANTLIVDRADYFGLAQLYQLRGRVGRSHHRAYCYLVVPEGVNEDAERRLRILEHYTELGSGYAIALKDLELRGAGNILGHEQSGFVHAVGLDTYTRLLEGTLRRMREGPGAVEPVLCDVALEGAALLPDAYVPDPAQKLHLYRRLSRLESDAELVALHAEVRDRFGPLPLEAGRLFLAARLRLLGTQLHVERILVRGDAARIVFAQGVSPRLTVLQGALHDQQVEVEVRRTAPLSLVLRRRGARAVADTLVDALELLSRDRARAA